MSDPARRLAEFLKTKPRLLGLIAGLNAAATTLDGVLADLAVTRVLATADGVWLDALGAIVGQEREGRTDADYRLWIGARVLLNKSSGGVAQILGVFEPIIPSGATLKLTQRAHASFEFEILGSSLTPAEAASFLRMLRLARAAGVGGQFIWGESPPGEWFTFDGYDQAFADTAYTRLHFKFDEADGSCASTVGGYSLAEGGAGSNVGVAGQINNARQASGSVGAYLEGSIGSGLDTIGDHTVSFWLRRSSNVGTAFGGDSVFIWTISSSNRGVYLYVSGGQNRFRYIADGGNAIDTVYTFTPGVTYHVAVRRAGNTWTLWVNGVLVTTETHAFAGFPSGGQTLRIFSSTVGGGFTAWDGWIDDLVLEAQALTDGAIGDVYTSGASPDPTALDNGKWRGATF